MATVGVSSAGTPNLIGGQQNRAGADDVLRACRPADDGKRAGEPAESQCVKDSLPGGRDYDWVTNPCRNDQSCAYTVLSTLSPQSTRGRCMQSRSIQSRERESRGSKTLWRGQGAEPLGFPNQHADVVCSRAQLNREKGVQRVEDPLAGSRGRASWVPQSTRGRCMQSRSTQSRKGSPEGRRPFGRCRAEPCRSPEAEPLAPPSERNCYEETEAVVCGAGLGALRVEAWRGACANWDMRCSRWIGTRSW